MVTPSHEKLTKLHDYRGPEKETTEKGQKGSASYLQQVHIDLERSAQSHIMEMRK